MYCLICSNAGRRPPPCRRSRRSPLMPELRIARGHVDLPCGARTGLYRRPEGVRMFTKKRREKILREHENRQTQERFERNERAGKEIYARMAQLKNVPRENLPDAVFMLSMAAKHYGEQSLTSITDAD